MDLIGWAIFIVALLVSVMLHETGHFLVAKRFGMKVTRYFVGFGPTIWSTWRGDTEYGIKALPLGGFVKIVGMHSLDDPDDPADELQAFRSHPAWQRILVLCAGSATHFLLALLLVFGLALGVGIANDNVTQLGEISPCVPTSLAAYNNGTCGSDAPASPAKLAGLRAGDTVTAFDGHPVSTFNQLGDAIRVGGVGPGVAGGVYSGRAVECGDDETGIVGDDELVGEAGVVEGFAGGVFGEGGEDLVEARERGEIWE